MAEEYLSINDSTLQSVADAIKLKAGIASNTKLAFPEGFKSTLQGIDAYAPATKIAATTETLTPSRTSYPIPAGVHTGNGKVRIRTTNTNLTNNDVAISSNTITPNNQTQVIEPPDGYFLNSIIISAMNASGYYQADYGTVTFSSISDSFEKSFSFTPEGFFIMLQDYGEASSIDKVCFINSATSGSGSTASSYMIYGKTNSQSSIYYYNQLEDSFINGQKLILSTTTTNLSLNFYGTYYYFVWGN